MPPKKQNAGVKAAGKGNNNHKLSSQLPEGTILQDFTKGVWKIGKPIGVGGFGLLYLAKRGATGAVTPNAEYVLKMEPHGNGPLFCELAFYQRVAKPDLIKSWMASRKLKSLGMPKFIATGLHEDKKEKNRFMVMERFGTDLQKLFEQKGKRFPRKTVITIGLQLLEVLEYIHSKEYCHADIKASNILLGYDKSSSNQVFLVDFGLAYRYTVDGKLKPGKSDPKWKHNGTIEFTSRDAHDGRTPSRRGDLEILAYCLLQWLCGKLPWEDKLSDCEYVQREKNKYMSNIPTLMTKCFPGGEKPLEIQFFLQYVNQLQYEDEPDYELCKKILRDGLKKLGFVDDGKLDFSSSASKTKASAKRTVTPKGKGKKAAISESEDETESDDEESDDEELCSGTKRKVSAKRKVTPKRKARSQSCSDSESDIPRAAKKKAPVKGKSTQRKKAIDVSDSESEDEYDSESEDEHIVRLTNGRKKVASPPAKRARSRIASPKNRKTKKPKAEVGCQTSPWLKGLKRSRKGK